MCTRRDSQSVGVIVGRAACTGEFAKPEAISSRTASQNAQSDASCKQARLTGAPFVYPMPDFCCAHDSRAHLGVVLSVILNVV